MASKDDDIIRTRLLLDGEGAGDDRKLTLILKSFLKVKIISNLTVIKNYLISRKIVFISNL